MKFISQLLIDKVSNAYNACEKYISKLIINYPKNRIMILDIGCNNGEDINRILLPVNKKYTVYGIDLVDENKVNKEIIYKKMNIENKRLPYDNEKFDIIFANQLIEHIIHKDKLIEQCHRILKRDGLFILGTENIASIDNIISVILGQEPIAQHTSVKYVTSSFLSPHFMKKKPFCYFHEGHKNVSSYYGLLRLVRINGFNKPKIKSFGHINRVFERLFPFHNRIIVVYAYK